MPDFVIAGATGRVGSVIVRRLIEGGHSVTGVTRSPEGGASLIAMGASVALETLANARGLAAIIDGATGFFVVLPEPVHANDFHAERGAVTQAIAQAVAASDPGHVVVMSSLGAQFAERMGPISDLHDLEQALRGVSRSVTILRAATFQENVAAVLEPAVHGGIYPNFQPHQDVAISMISTRDVGTFAADLLREPPGGDVVDVLGPWYSPRQVAETLGRMIGRSLEIVDIPPAGHVGAFRQAGLSQTFAEALAELQEAIASGRISPVGDRRKVGTTTLEETLTRILERGTAGRNA